MSITLGAEKVTVLSKEKNRGDFLNLMKNI